MISEEILDDCRIKFDAKTTFLETFEGYLLQLLASFVTYLPWAFIVPLAGTIISFLRTPKAISEALIDHPLAYILTYHNWFLLYFGVWLIFRPVLRAFELALIFLKKSADEQHAKYQINAQVLFYSKKHGVSIKLPWSELKASQKTKRVLVLRFAKLTLTLPFRAVPPEQVPELLSYAVPKR